MIRSVTGLITHTVKQRLKLYIYTRSMLLTFKVSEGAVVPPVVAEAAEEAAVLFSHDEAL